MDDSAILDRFFARSETAVDETAAKYGAYCRTIASHILQDTAPIDISPIKMG